MPQQCKSPATTNTGIHGNLSHTWEPLLNERVDLVDDEAQQQVFVQWAVGGDDHALKVRCPRGGVVVGGLDTKRELVVRHVDALLPVHTGRCRQALVTLPGGSSWQLVLIRSIWKVLKSLEFDWIKFKALKSLNFTK